MGFVATTSARVADAKRTQEFFNLTADEVKIDSVLPCFHYSLPLGSNYAASDYEVSIDYPEFLDMSKSDIARYGSITSDALPEMPVVSQYIGVSRKSGTLYVSFVPLVFRDGKYQKLVSFMLNIKPVSHEVSAARRAAAGDGRYAEHSVLATGQWAKIRVPETGIYQLTDALVRQAGFSSLSKVKIYGYGGAMQPEKLTADYIASTDDLKEVPSCTINGRRLFHAVGPVNWASKKAVARERNACSNYGYYFLTESDEEPLSVDSTTFVEAFYPGPNDYHDINEVDNYSWFHGGRNLYNSEKLTIGSDYTVNMPGTRLPAGSQTSAQLNVNLSFDATFEATVSVNGKEIGKVVPSTSLFSSKTGKPSDSYAVATQANWTFAVPDTLMNSESNTVVINQTSGGTVRLDYVSFAYTTAKPLPHLSTTSFSVPEYVYRITNQDHHADPQADMVIIIPTSQIYVSEAERLKTLHETYDSMRVNLVPADELFNEFSSGTPDVNAYRRYMKMLYDRAETEADMPRFLVLFGDGAWDNRMLTSDWRGCSPDNFLLCYESENSFSETKCYVSDDFFCLLDDGEGGNVLTDKIDAAVGRLSARNSAQAKVLVDKIYTYRTNEQAGAWQNTLCFMGDDGDQNRHMQDAEAVLDTVLYYNTAYNIKKIYWDAYTRVTSATGNSYPDVTRLIHQQMQSGALVMNYSGHGRLDAISHEYVITLPDFAKATSLRLPLWVTASCDIMPFDGQDENIGETAMFNEKGGAIAFYGTTRTVYASYNRPMNQSFMKYVLATDKNGRRYTIGEAGMLAKNDFTAGTTEMVTNKQQYSLLGDPALVLAAPTIMATIDEINGEPVGGSPKQLKAGSIATVKGHIPNHDDFNGVATFTVRDIEETITGKMNNVTETSTAIVYKDRPNTIYSGSNSVTNGEFTFTFSVPKDISYSSDTGLFLVYAVNEDKTLEAHGENDNFTLSGYVDTVNDEIGPSIYCYLNSSSFVNGGEVNSTPYFYAEITDKDGINVAGSGIGHDLELIIDGDMGKTYNLNEYFEYDFGDYQRGTVGFSIPELADGPHKLRFRAWDMLNNSSRVELSFVVNAKLEPSGINVICTENPAKNHTRFVISHDRVGSEMDVELEVFDTSGRKLWGRTETGIPTDHTYTIDWDLTTNTGHLRTGVYLYRILVSSNGSKQASQARKLIVLGNN